MPTVKPPSKHCCARRFRRRGLSVGENPGHQGRRKPRHSAGRQLCKNQKYIWDQLWCFQHWWIDKLVRRCVRATSHLHTKRLQVWEELHQHPHGGAQLKAFRGWSKWWLSLLLYTSLRERGMEESGLRRPAWGWCLRLSQSRTSLTL